MIGAMSAILYPVAVNAEQALARPAGRATRVREARAMAGEAVVFAPDPTGPAFASREAAEDAYRAPLGEGFARVAEQILPGQRVAAVQPVYAEGRRWPQPPARPPRTAWRLMVSYWRIATAERPIEAPQARMARRAGAPLSAETLRRIAGEPLRPIAPQQPLDIGLFERRLPENPDIVVPDE